MRTVAEAPRVSAAPLDLPEDMFVTIRHYDLGTWCDVCMRDVHEMGVSV